MTIRRTGNRWQAVVDGRTVLLGVIREIDIWRVAVLMVQPLR
jgi:hypothetical protein